MSILLISEYVRRILAEGNLAKSQMKGDRFQKFLSKILKSEPFDLVSGGQIVIPAKGKGNKVLVAALRNGDAEAYAAAFDIGVIDSSGNLIRPSNLQKTAEFGGKSAEVSLAAEAGQIGNIQSAIQAAGNGRPINIIIGSKLVKRVVGIEKVGGTPKADAMLVDDKGVSVAYVSLKASDTAKQMQQWGGITKFVNDPEVSSFVNDVAKIVTDSTNQILPYPVFRGISSKELKTQIVYGDGSSPQETVDVIIASLGNITLKPMGKNLFMFDVTSGEIHYNPELPGDDWDPVLLARPGASRKDLGVPNTRFGVFPFGYRASSRMPIETLMKKTKKKVRTI